MTRLRNVKNTALPVVQEDLESSATNAEIVAVVNKLLAALGDGRVVPEE